MKKEKNGSKEEHEVKHMQTHVNTPCEKPQRAEVSSLVVVLKESTEEEERNREECERALECEERDKSLECVFDNVSLAHRAKND